MISGIYVIEINGMYYVGSTSDFEKRFKTHIDLLSKNKHHNIILQRSFNKYGIRHLKTSIIEELEYTKEQILEKEQFYIDLYRAEHKNRCCNISDASFGDTKTNHPNRNEIIEKAARTTRENNSKLTEQERRAKWAQPGEKNGMFGRTHSEEVKQKFREKIYTEDTRNKMSESAKTKFKNRPDLRNNLSYCASQRTGAKNPFYGREHSEETKKKIAEKNKGKIPGNAIRISINNKEYSSYHEASCDLDIPHTTIRWRCLSENKKFKDYKILS